MSSAKLAARAEAPAPPPRIPPFLAALRPSAFLAAFAISVRQMARPKRLLTLTAIFLLPLLVLGVVRFLSAQGAVPPYGPDEAAVAEDGLVLMLLPSVLVPITGLFLASGMIRDEIEGQTLTYLLVRPLWRPALYVTKWKAAWLISFLLAAASTLILFIGMYAGVAEPSGWLPRCGRCIALFALVLLAYTGVFGLLSMITARGALLGVVYLLAFEQVFANINFVARQATVLYHFRSLAMQWLDLKASASAPWSMEAADLPAPWRSVSILAGIGIASIALGAFLFRLREFRMKGAGGD